MSLPPLQIDQRRQTTARVDFWLWAKNRLLENELSEPPNEQSAKYKEESRAQTSAFSTHACTYLCACVQMGAHRHAHLHVHAHIAPQTCTHTYTHGSRCPRAYTVTDAQACICMLTNTQAQEYPPQHRSHFRRLYHSQEATPYHGDSQPRSAMPEEQNVPKKNSEGSSRLGRYPP